MNKQIFALLFLCTATFAADSDIFLGEDHHPGFITIRDNGDDLFYWLFKSRGDMTNDPLVFWLTGGPGCSSEIAIFFENGPYHIKDDLSLTINSNSWNEHANVVYMDQPLGTGFSHFNGV